MRDEIQCSGAEHARFLAMGHGLGEHNRENLGQSVTENACSGNPIVQTMHIWLKIAGKRFRHEQQDLILSH